MANNVYFQSKPSLSVRTRALVDRYHVRFLNKYNLLRNSFNLRLRRHIANRRKLDYFDTSNDPNNNAFCAPTQSDESSMSNSDNFSSANETNNVITTASDACTFSSASSTSSVLNGQTSACKWDDCDAVEVKRSQLINHIYQMHVIPQLLFNRRKYFCCLWRDCRVFGCPSVSSSWLENHVLHHTDAKGKPFVCIFDGCNMRFSTSLLLERHVLRNHLGSKHNLKYSISFDPSNSANTQESQNLSTFNNLNKPTESTTPTKRNLKRRKKTRPYIVRRTDFYDARTQAIIRNHLKVKYLIENKSFRKNSQIFSDRLCTKPHGLPIKIRLSTHFNGTRCLGSQVNHLSFNEQNIDMFNQMHEFTTSDEFQYRISLLLTTPYTFVGQRLSEDDRCEFLIQWRSEFVICRPCGFQKTNCDLLKIWKHYCDLDDVYKCAITTPQCMENCVDYLL